jgi:hypothetical protein
MIERPAVPGAVIRPLVEPVPVYPWAIPPRRLDAPRAATLRSVATELAGQAGWWETRPEGAWLPTAEARWSSRS